MKTYFELNDLNREIMNLSNDNNKAVKQFRDKWNDMYPNEQIVKLGKIIEINPDKGNLVKFEAEVNIIK